MFNSVLSLLSVPTISALAQSLNTFCAYKQMQCFSLFMFPLHLLGSPLALLLPQNINLISPASSLKSSEGFTFPTGHSPRVFHKILRVLPFLIWLCFFQTSLPSILYCITTTSEYANEKSFFLQIPLRTFLFRKTFSTLLGRLFLLSEQLCLSLFCL